ncbi:MAG: helix-turn-helix transcriptional regulator [Candidatus Didemnitutus sp.]|nr:helix-turn-helix transcriptional regulator [Candidatus Didemnitutus sp.]
MSASKASINLGKTVRELRVRAKKSQMALAEDTDLSLTYISEIERGKRSVSLDVLVKVARAFDMSPGDLLNKAEIW